MIESNGVLNKGFLTLQLSPELQRCTSKLGYKIHLFNENGEFRDIVKMPDDTSKVSKCHFGSINVLEGALKEHLKSYYTYLVYRYLPSTVQQYHDAILCLVSKISDCDTFDDALEETIMAKPASFTTPIKTLVRFLILNEYEGLSFDKAEEILRLEGYASNKNSYLWLFTVDEELGPFTREEMRVLNGALKNESIFIVDRLILALCIQFGLRSIQISLLKEEDFVEDAELGFCYLNVPRLKQKGQTFRRELFTKRPVDDELAGLIKRVLKHNSEAYKDLNLENPPLIYRKYIDYVHGSRGSSKAKEGCKGVFLRVSHVGEFKTDQQRSYIYHLPPSSLNYRLHGVMEELPLSPRTGKPFHLTPYRFRYTVGTNAVMEGMTEEEVAYLLDHSSTLCVKHYFRYTREMWELLENATRKRTEQRHFTAAWSREKDLSGNIYGKEVIEPSAFTAIGRCHKKAACYLEPAVACYACDEFCPNKDKVSHNNALTSLKKRKQVVADTSPVTLTKQLDEAIAGCEAAIAYSDGIKVVNINSGGSGE